MAEHEALFPSPVIIGHRGSGRGVNQVGLKENTEASLLAAHEAGAAWVEFDILPTLDQELVLHHDFFDERGPIWTQSRRHLAGRGVEELTKVSAHLPVELGFYVELKAVPGELEHHKSAFLDATLAWALTEQERRQVLLASLDPSLAAHLAGRGVPVAWITREHWDLFEVVSASHSFELQAVVVHGPTTLSPEKRDSTLYGIELAAQLGVEVAAWDTPLLHLRELTRLGVLAHCVDDVAAGVALL